MEINPIDKKDELLHFLKMLGVSASVHKKSDTDYEYLQENDLCITVQNPYSDHEYDLYIDMEDDGEFTVSFHAYHQHFYPCDTAYTQMLNDIQDVVTEKAYVWVCYEDDDWCMVGMSDGTEHRHQPPKDLKPNQKVECVYWNPEKNFTIEN